MRLSQFIILLVSLFSVAVTTARFQIKRANCYRGLVARTIQGTETNAEVEAMAERLRAELWEAKLELTKAKRLKWSLRLKSRIRKLERQRDKLAKEVTAFMEELKANQGTLITGKQVRRKKDLSVKMGTLVGKIDALERDVKKYQDGQAG